MSKLRRWGIGLVVALWVAVSAVAHAHVADTEDWSATYRRLIELFPKAAPDRWKVLRYHLSKREARRLRNTLGFDLDPLDYEPRFYVAHDRRGALLGVAMFIEPHAHDAGHASFEVDVAVGPRGRIRAVRAHHAAKRGGLSSARFLRQFEGRDLESSFSLSSGDELRAVPGMAAESQLVANAAHEALVYMKVVLGRSGA